MPIRNGNNPGGRGVSATTRLAVAAVAGVAVGIAIAQVAGWPIGMLAGWIAFGVVFVGWMWATLWPMDAAETAAHATRDDPGRGATDLTVNAASLVSLLAVGLFLFNEGSADQTGRAVQALITVASVALAWATVHTVFAARYAQLYYTEPPGGIDYNEDDRPRYSDFAYLAFTIGMTFQVSDTDLKTKTIRATALRHALLSYVFGTVVLAVTINLVAGLAK